jgi:hypothetical protein
MQREQTKKAVSKRFVHFVFHLYFDMLTVVTWTVICDEGFYQVHYLDFPIQVVIAIITEKIYVNEWNRRSNSSTTSQLAYLGTGAASIDCFCH